MSIEFDFDFHGRSNDPANRAGYQENFFRIGYSACCSVGCNGEGSTYPAMFLARSGIGDVLDIKVSSAASCGAANYLHNYTLSTTQTHHIKISFNNTQVVVDITGGGQPTYNKQWNRQQTPKDYLGDTVNVYFLSDTFYSTPYNRGWATFNNIIIKSNIFTFAPTAAPTMPSTNPTTAPTAPTTAPSENPSKYPSKLPTKTPTKFPTEIPSENPTKFPTKYPTDMPSKTPSAAPTIPTTISTNYHISTSTNNPITTATNTPIIPSTTNIEHVIIATDVINNTKDEKMDINNSLWYIIGAAVFALICICCVIALKKKYNSKSNVSIKYYNDVVHTMHRQSTSLQNNHLNKYNKNNTQHIKVISNTIEDIDLTNTIEGGINSKLNAKFDSNKHDFSNHISDAVKCDEMMLNDIHNHVETAGEPDIIS
eukprot:504959_1